MHNRITGDRRCIYLQRTIPFIEGYLNHMEWLEGIGVAGITAYYTSGGLTGWLQCSWKDTVHELSDVTGYWPPMPDTACICAMGVDETELLNSIKLSPNPTTNWLSISLSQQANSFKSISVLNYLGQQVAIRICSGNETGIDLHNFPPGLYTAIVSTINGRVARSFIKR